MKRYEVMTLNFDDEEGVTVQSINADYMYVGDGGALTFGKYEGSEGVVTYAFAPGTWRHGTLMD